MMVSFGFLFQIGSAQTVSCPSNHKQAENYLREYLKSQKTIDSLRQKRNLNLNKNTFKKIIPIQGEENKMICTKLLENAPWLKNFENYSFYETENYYYVVTYSISQNVYSSEGLNIFNKEFERLISVISF